MFTIAVIYLQVKYKFQEMIIRDLDGREYKIYNLEEFKNHIKQFHTVNGKPDGSLHEENGYYFRVDKSFYDLLFKS